MTIEEIKIMLAKAEWIKEPTLELEQNCMQIIRELLYRLKVAEETLNDLANDGEILDAQKAMECLKKIRGSNES